MTRPIPAAEEARGAPARFPAGWRLLPAALAAGLLAGLIASTGCSAKPQTTIRERMAAAASAKSIHEAAGKGDLASMTAFLSKGISLEEKDERDWTPLMWASAGGYIAIMDELLNRGASPHAKGQDGVTAIQLAAWKGQTQAAHRLLARGAEVDVMTDTGYTPLMTAVQFGHVETAKALLSMGADVNARTKKGDTPLNSAAGNGNLELVELLMAKGADVNSKDDSGQPPIYYAGLNRHAPVVAALVKAGARPEGVSGRVGLQVKQEEGATSIVRAMEDTPASRAGLQAGDVIVSVDGRDAAGMKLADVVDLIRGPVGARLVVRVTRKGVGQPMDFAVIRDSAVVLPAALAAGGGTVLPSVPSRVPGPPKARDKASEGLRPSDAATPRYRAEKRKDDFALVIGIEEYARLPKALFAERDAKAVAGHMEALGVPRRNIIHLSGADATRASLQGYLEEWLPRNVKPSSRVYFYYSGHGAPDPGTGDAFLVPWDGDPMFLKSSAYPIGELFARLGKLKVQEVVVALDACFSGAGGRSVLAKGARPLVVEVKESVPSSGKLSVLAAASGNEITTTREDQGHGLFTYHLLKGLNEGRRGTRELYEYLKPLVEDDARRQNREQTPSHNGRDLSF